MVTKNPNQELNPNSPFPYPILLRRRAVEKRTGLGRSHIYALIAKGQFPTPIKLTRGTVAWPEREISAWIEGRIEASRCNPQFTKGTHI